MDNWLWGWSLALLQYLAFLGRRIFGFDCGCGWLGTVQRLHEVQVCHLDIVGAAKCVCPWTFRVIANVLTTTR
jgi:hypothetical protein